MPKPLTQFVRDRMRERDYANPEHRRYIRDLLRIEEILKPGARPSGWADSVARTAQCNDHWVESECIGWELREGRYTDPLTFRHLLKSPDNQPFRLELKPPPSPSEEELRQMWEEAQPPPSQRPPAESGPAISRRTPPDG
jgi:hypothetical protein